MYDVASSLKAKVSSVLKEKSYVWKPLRSISLLSIQSKLPLADIGEETWNKIRLRLSEVNWWKLIWFFTAIPRHDSSLGLLRKTNYMG